MFGYLNCRDICHSQAIVFQELNHAADMQDKLVFLYIALDPERDSIEQLSSYFDSRGDNFFSLHGRSPRHIQDLALKYRNYFYREGSFKGDDYEIRHDGKYFLISPEGNIRYTYASTQVEVRGLAQDLFQLKHEDSRFRGNYGI